MDLTRIHLVVEAAVTAAGVVEVVLVAENSRADWCFVRGPKDMGRVGLLASMNNRPRGMDNYLGMT